MGKAIYYIFTRLYLLGIHIASLFNPKAATWIKGRKDVYARLRTFREQHPGKLVWMHCASLGEFEQGRPVLEQVRQQYPDTLILLTFFSPSGYEIRKNYAGADLVLYLPMDGPSASRFVAMAKPSLVLWVKYEYWYYYLAAIAQTQIPLLLVSGIFRENQPFFSWYGQLWRKMLGFFTRLFVQNEESVELLKKYGLDGNAEISGDTRFDRVLALAHGESNIPAGIKSFCTGHKVLVAGSTWEPDEAELVHFARANKKIRFIIAPHEIHGSHIRQIKAMFRDCAIAWSEVQNDKPNQPGINVLIIDQIGMLASLYALADVTYIGGGFGDAGIHNTLEAAVYGKPVVFGPNYEKFAEAVGMVEDGCAFPVNTAMELEKTLTKLFVDEPYRCHAGEMARDFVSEHAGATGHIMEYIQEKRLLTN